MPCAEAAEDQGASEECTPARSKLYHATDAFAFVHQVESVVDALERQHVSDHRIDLDLAVQIFFDIARQLGATFYTAEGGAAPRSARHQLKRPGADYLPCAGNADDNRFAPAFMATFERRAHGFDVADAFKRIVHAAVRHFNDDLLNRTAVCLRLDEIGGAEISRHFKLGVISIDGDNSLGFGHDEPLNDAEADAAQAENCRDRSRPHFRGVQYRAYSGGDAAAEQANFIERRGGIDLCDGDRRQHRIFGKCRSPHVVKDRFAAHCKTRSAVRHDAFAL